MADRYFSAAAGPRITRSMHRFDAARLRIEMHSFAGYLFDALFHVFIRAPVKDLHVF
jgi:hypothetical protein